MALTESEANISSSQRLSSLLSAVFEGKATGGPPAPRLALKDDTVGCADSRTRTGPAPTIWVREHEMSLHHR